MSLRKVSERKTWRAGIGLGDQSGAAGAEDGAVTGVTAEGHMDIRRHWESSNPVAIIQSPCLKFP
jgi:hypothetical protein